MATLNKKQIILFDLDGTITDSGEGIMNSVKYALEAFGINNHDEALLRKFIGPPLKESMHRLFGFSEEKSLEAVVKYREYFGEYGIFENRLYDGVEQMLKDLKDAGRILVLATSKTEMYMDRILEHFGIARYFDAAAGSLYDGSRIKKGEVVRHALELVRDGLVTHRFELNKAEKMRSGPGVEEKFLAEAVMIGDREQDIAGAKENGIESAGVLYGYGSREELEKAGATYIIQTVDELRNRLLGG